MKKASLKKMRGFTLLEVIVTMVIAAILATFVVSFMGTNLTASVLPIIRTQNESSIIGVMDRMTSDYKNLLMTDTSGDPLNTFRTRVASTVPNSYGTYTLEDGTPKYVVFNSSGTESLGSSPGNILRVTIIQGEQRLTALFVK